MMIEKCSGAVWESSIKTQSTYIERPLPGSEAQTEEAPDALNTLFIVAFAVFISFLAMRLAARGRKK